MKLLVLGGKGMAGHVLTAYLKQKHKEVYYTSRDATDETGYVLDVLDTLQLETLIEELQPDVVINAIGILNEHAEQNEQLAFQINALLPHQLVKLMNRRKGKVIHISTDCVFKGDKGYYTETDQPDGTSVYAKTKALGEITDSPHLTVRTSIIGPELKENGIGLLLWFLKQKGEIKGFNQALWNGVTTLELAKAIDYFLEQKTTGLYHLHAPERISKFELLGLFKEVFEKDDVTIVPSNSVKLDRTIVHTRKDVFYEVKPYRVMLQELKVWMKVDD
jgi:dTDP-4-dehydrorhamnose reductase